MTQTFSVGPSTIRVIFGDISTSKCQVLVSSDDFGLSMGGGVSRALLRSGGSAISRDAAKVGFRKLGDVVVTSAGKLPAAYLLHAITIGPRGLDEVPTEVVVRSVTRKVMDLLPMLGCDSVALPAIGTGAAGMNYEAVASEMAASLVEALLSTLIPYQVEIYLSDRDGQGLAFLQLFSTMLSHRFGLSNDTTTEVSDRRSKEILHLLSQLGARRSVLESQLIELLNDEDSLETHAIQQVREQLEELNRVASSYERDRLLPSNDRGHDLPGSVFVSSTSQDLASHRTSVRGVVERLGLCFVGMEDFAAESATPAEMIRRRVMESETYLGILGMRYGFVDEGTGLSMTELEYQQAVAGRKPLKIFVMSDDAPILASMVERDPVKLEKLNEFKSRVLKSHSCGMFSNEQDLAEKVEKSLRDGR